MSLRVSQPLESTSAQAGPNRPMRPPCPCQDLGAGASLGSCARAWRAWEALSTRESLIQLESMAGASLAAPTGVVRDAVRASAKAAGRAVRSLNMSSIVP